MSSSNRHWPSMFKSKPCNSQNQWQHEMNSSLGSTGYQRSPFSSAAEEERSPEPKARWNPKPEQIRILEAIFNSGMVNPPRDEIRKIRVQLQEYGQVGDANVFYWFQNRKSRSKHKLRQLQNLKNQNQERTTASLSQITTPPSSSSSSSDKSSSKELVHPKGFSFGFDAVPNSPTASVNQTYFRPHINNDTNLLLPAATEPFSYPMHNYVQAGVATDAIATPGYSLSEFPNSMMQPQQCQQNVGPCTSLLLSEIMNSGIPSKKDQDQDKALGIMQHQAQLNFSLTSTPTSVPSIAATPISSPYPITQLQGVGEAATDGAKCIVFINDVALEVAMGPLNVRQLFGDEAMLIQSTGHPVPTDEWGVTLNPLQHGAYYYLI